MATVNFSVPEKVKQVFNAVFAGRNKSAIIAELMLRAVEEQRARESRAQAIDRLLARRSAKRRVTDANIRAAREPGQAYVAVSRVRTLACISLPATALPSRPARARSRAVPKTCVQMSLPDFKSIALNRP